MSAEQQPLWPDMEADEREGLEAEHRERVQHARARLADRDLSWLANRLLDGGPATEHALMMDAFDQDLEERARLGAGGQVLCDLYDLWLVGKLWRRRLGVHPGSGMEMHLYGIAGVHENRKEKETQ